MSLPNSKLHNTRNLHINRIHRLWHFSCSNFLPTKAKLLRATSRSSPSSVSKYYDIQSKNVLKRHFTKSCKWAFFSSNELNMRWKTPCLWMNNADFDIYIYVMYWTKYPEIFLNKMAFTDCETCQFIEFSNTKFSKTAGLWRWKQANSDFL